MSTNKKKKIDVHYFSLELLKQARVSKDKELWFYQDGDVQYQLTKQNGRSSISVSKR